MEEQTTVEYARFRLRRDSNAVLEWFRRNWRERRLFRWAAAAIGAFVLLTIVAWFWLARDLPDAETLLDYETPLPTVVRGIDGEIVHSYARERRVQLQYVDFPQRMIEAYLSAEDKTFFSHGGVDLTGTANAVFDYAVKYGSGERAVGGSTITQQVAKNLLLGDEYSVTRKLKEMILARRIEGVLSKQEILELYLNEIPLGRRSFGVQAASRAYFDKDVGDLDLHEMAFLSILPKAPERYGRKANESMAIDRRNFVLRKMEENGFITAAEMREAQAKPLGLVTQRSERSVDAGYFLEEVRRSLIEQFGETAETSSNSVYAGGLWVRTSLDPEMQIAARDALRAGLLRYHGSRGWTGPIATLDVSEGNWASQLASSYLSVRYEDWRVGVVTQRSGSSAKIGFSDGSEVPLTGLPDKLKAGDVIAASPSGSGYRVRTIPEVSGGFIAEQVQTGRVLAMQGGFDNRLSDFNRATQALRQPGSTIKPFVYATGLDNGMTPASEVPDQTFCFYQGANLGEKCFRNFGGGGGGVHTMRWGLEQSRNLMTVHIAMEAGMPQVIKTFENMKIGSYEPYPAFALGAGDTTVQKMVNAYAALANHGRLHESTLIDYVQDRHGKVIWRADKRKCTNCNMPEWDGKAMPRFGLQGKEVIDPRTAYQVVHMLEGVVTRGTAVRLRDLNLPLFGKTGTTSGPTNAWFVGGSPEVVAGVYVGFDQPRNLGGWVQGGNTAAPIFKEFVQKTKDRWKDEPPVAPAGIRMVRIDRISGKRVFDAWPTDDPKASVIWEAFKPDTEPARSTRQDEIAAKRKEILELIRRGRGGGEQQTVVTDGEGQPADFVEDQGGIY
ncbi:Multimodular transpeptidase-transglycosylase [Altererythrobacter epoxidivorans]|uniref:Multimodular transpeptidase-transglycosylase n=1 Tax=Altererythrobacter epoxidivorans TaxID=361183 RepID=A0A0M5L6V1_9SPHN|nr:transglycosylase domain-containing protein [Altererythrobacter epoxidivorans]ALE16569.1 Multimodular transpeptidase-transglycosylase [Altererythrobacter epoxidivorans]